MKRLFCFVIILVAGCATYPERPPVDKVWTQEELDRYSAGVIEALSTEDREFIYVPPDIAEAVVVGVERARALDKPGCKQLDIADHNIFVILEPDSVSLAIDPRFVPDDDNREGVFPNDDGAQTVNLPMISGARRLTGCYAVIDIR